MGKDSIIWSLLMLLLFAGTSCAIADDANIRIFNPAPNESIDATPYNAYFDIIGTDYKAFNCSWFVDGVSYGSSAVVKNNTNTTASLALLKGQATDSHGFEVACSNSTSEYLNSTSFMLHFIPVYATGDLPSIVIDLLGGAGVFMYENTTLIGVCLLLGFITAAMFKYGKPIKWQ